MPLAATAATAAAADTADAADAAAATIAYTYIRRQLAVASWVSNCCSRPNCTKTSGTFAKAVSSNIRIDAD